MSLSFKVQARRNGFSLDVAFETEARALAVVGASGAGKTTLLEALAGHRPADCVRLAVDGQVIVDTALGLAPRAHRRAIGYVFQDGRLFPHLTVGGNVGFARAYAVQPMEVSEALRLVGLEGFERRWPNSLSGGEQRRVAFARALVARPRLLLLDEPFTGLDEARRKTLTPHLIHLRETTGTPIVIVSHDPRDVADLAQAVLTIGEGRRIV